MVVRLVARSGGRELAQNQPMIVAEVKNCRLRVCGYVVDRVVIVGGGELSLLAREVEGRPKLAN